ncbi:hypothetical protein LINPERHAP1_LOCUS21624 [Linum perenne]
MEQKRGHHWFTDCCQLEHLSNKKPATDAVKDKPALNALHENDYPWNNLSNVQLLSGQTAGHLFGSERVHKSGVVERRYPSAGGGSRDMGLKKLGVQHVSGSYMGLSISHNIEDHSGSLELNGLTKVRVNHVTDSDKDFCTLMNHSYSGASSSLISENATLNKSVCGNSLTLAPAYSENVLSMDQSLGQRKVSFTPMGTSYANQDNTLMLIPPRKHEGWISISPNYTNSNVDVMSTIHSSWKRNDNLISVSPSFGNLDFTIKSTVPTLEKGESGILSLGNNYGENANGNIISFGAFCGTKVSSSGAEIDGYGVSFPGCSSGYGSAEVPSQKISVQLNPDAAPKNNQPKNKKDVSNNFPSNVKSLLSTGILDDVPVKYVSWSREKSVKGIIKGTGYLCGCSECNYSKSVNAFELERHAKCKTKHPNNHIYFENGKTIYGVVQELKNTPQEKLFHAVQSVTGSEINQKNFLSWKESFEAAARELQRIYGMDEVGGRTILRY